MRYNWHVKCLQLDKCGDIYTPVKPSPHQGHRHIHNLPKFPSAPITVVTIIIIIRIFNIRSTLLENFKYTTQYYKVQALFCILLWVYLYMFSGNYLSFTETLYLLTITSPFPPVYILFSASMNLSTLDSTFKWDDTIFVCLCLVYFTSLYIF